MLSDIDINDRKTNRALLVKKLLANLGFYEVWLQQNVGDVASIFLSIVRQRLHDNYLLQWNEEINQSPPSKHITILLHFQKVLIWLR